MNHTLFTFLLLTLLPGSSLSCGEIRDHIDPGLLRRADQIEIVRVDDKFSHIEYKKNRPEIPSLTPPLSGLSLSGVSLAPFGPCSFESNTLRRTGAGHCGLILDLAEKGALNLLSYDSVSIAGHFTGTWRVAIADYSHYLGNDSVPFGTIGNGGGASFALAPLISKVDLTQAKRLVFVPGSKKGSFSLANISFTRTPMTPPPSAGHGIWIWDFRRISGREAAVAEELRSLGIRRVYLQVGDRPDLLLPFVKQAALRGIRVFALDGSPAYVREPEPLLRRIRAVMEYNIKYPDTPFDGFQIDVEPYLNKDFSINREYYSAGYIDLLRKIGKLCRGKLRLSAVIPFWFVDIPAGERNIAFTTIDLADETVVMSYRSGYGAILETARDILAYGEKKGKPVLLGIEINRIADERHSVLRKVAAGTAGGVELGGLLWEEVGDYQVPGGNLSFFGRPEEARAVIGRMPGYGSFAGWVIHSYEGLSR
jgi:hypothetical protein